MTPSKTRSRERAHKVRTSPVERLAWTVAQGPLHPTDVVIEPEGQVKMSDVLEQFVEPYLKFARTTDEQRKLFALAALAWNAALLPPVDREKMIAEVIGAAISADARQAKADARNIIDLLIARKLAHFADNTRRVIKVEVTETRDGFHLAVASTL
jgi:hypothetical protein